MDSRRKSTKKTSPSVAVPVEEDEDVMYGVSNSTSIRPLETRFELLTWTSPVAYANMTRILTHMDNGSSFVHACLNAFYIPYRDGKLYNQNIGQVELTHMFRRELATSLLLPSPSGKKYVELLGNGTWVSMTSTNIETLAFQLGSPSVPFDSVMIEHISNVIDKDIIIIDAETQDIIVDSIETSTRYKNRTTIILLSVKNHYEVMSIRLKTGEFITHFHPNHAWVRQLRNLIALKVVTD